MTDYVVVVAGGLAANAKTGQPGFGVKAYGPFPDEPSADAASVTIRQLEGGAVMVRPLVSLRATLERISRD